MWSNLWLLVGYRGGSGEICSEKGGGEWVFAWRLRFFGSEGDR